MCVCMYVCVCMCIIVYILGIPNVFIASHPVV